MSSYRLDTEACSRCLGSGQYSYCQMYGTRCFKCGGSGQALTKAARKVSTKLAEHLKSVGISRQATKRGYEVTAHKVPVGALVVDEKKWQRVVSVEPDRSECSGWNLIPERHETSWYTVLVLSNGRRLRLPDNQIVIRTLSAEERAARVAIFAAHVGKGVTAVEEPAVVAPAAPAPEHFFPQGAEFCSCGQDAVICQMCGRTACGSLSTWMAGKGNVGLCCAALVGLGHAGTARAG